MKPLEVSCRHRILFVQLSIHDNSMGIKDRYLYNKNGHTFYVFRDYL